MTLVYARMCYIHLWVDFMCKKNCSQNLLFWNFICCLLVFIFQRLFPAKATIVILGFIMKNLTLSSTLFIKFAAQFFSWKFHTGSLYTYYYQIVPKFIWTLKVCISNSLKTLVTIILQLTISLLSHLYRNKSTSTLLVLFFITIFLLIQLLLIQIYDTFFITNKQWWNV